MLADRSQPLLKAVDQIFVFHLLQPPGKFRNVGMDVQLLVLADLKEEVLNGSDQLLCHARILIVGVFQLVGLDAEPVKEPGHLIDLRRLASIGGSIHDGIQPL